MPQELQVLTCYQCETFQVQIVTKVRKWTCKMCGEKQSIKKIYFRGTGKECREIVKDLNAQRLQMEENQNFLDMSKISENSEDLLETSYSNEDKLDSCYKIDENKWSDFMESNVEQEEDNEYESEKFTFARKSVKRKSKKVKEKEAYAYDDYSEPAGNDAKFIKNKNKVWNRKDTTFKNNYSDDKQVLANYSGERKLLSENVFQRNCKENVSKDNKWAEDLENQSDEEFIESSSDLDRENSENYSKKLKLNKNSGQQKPSSSGFKFSSSFEHTKQKSDQGKNNRCCASENITQSKISEGKKWLRNLSSEETDDFSCKQTTIIISPINKSNEYASDEDINEKSFDSEGDGVEEQTKEKLFSQQEMHNLCSKKIANFNKWSDDLENQSDEQSIGEDDGEISRKFVKSQCGKVLSCKDLQSTNMENIFESNEDELDLDI